MKTIKRVITGLLMTCLYSSLRFIACVLYIEFFVCSITRTYVQLDLQTSSQDDYNKLQSANWSWKDTFSSWPWCEYAGRPTRRKQESSPAGSPWIPSIAKGNHDHDRVIPGDLPSSTSGFTNIPLFILSAILTIKGSNDHFHSHSAHHRYLPLPQRHRVVRQCLLAHMLLIPAGLRPDLHILLP